MPNSPEHPSGWTLELLAEEALASEEAAKVSAHVQGCERCAAEVDAYQSLFATMASLPSLAPSADFADAVMARVNLTPKSSATSWLVGWLPSTRRGWALLLGLSLAPALPLIALISWMITQPLVTPAAVWDVAASWGADLGWTILVESVGRFVDSGIVPWARALLDGVLALPPEWLVGGTLLLAVGIPLSVWILYRTLRTPSRGTVYAH